LIEVVCSGIGSSTPLVGDLKNKKRAGFHFQPSFIWFTMWEISWQRGLNGKNGVAHVASDDIVGSVSQDKLHYSILMGMPARPGIRVFGESFFCDQAPLQEKVTSNCHQGAEIR
jgi:hypothetical protein